MEDLSEDLAEVLDEDGMASASLALYPTGRCRR